MGRVKELGSISSGFATALDTQYPHLYECEWEHYVVVPPLSRFVGELTPTPPTACAHWMVGRGYLPLCTCSHLRVEVNSHTERCSHLAYTLSGGGTGSTA